MRDLFYLSETLFNRIKPYFPLSHGVARVDDPRVISGIIYVIRNGLQWKDAPPCRSHKGRPELKASCGLQRSGQACGHAPVRRADERLQGSTPAAAVIAQSQNLDCRPRL
jgi:hypothetical protein